MRKYWLIVTFLAAFVNQMVAQTGNEVSVSVTIPPPFSPYLSEYSDLLNQGIITLTNLTASPQSLKLVGFVQGDNGLEAFTNPNYQPFNPILLNPFETKVILASQQNQEYLDANNISYNASQSVINNILQTGILPEGNYQICIRALDFNNNQPLSPEAPMGCVFFPVIYVQPPFLTFPMCEDSVNVTSNIMTFNWLPVSAATPVPMLYDLYIVQLMAGQNPNDAIMGAINFGAGNPIVKTGLVTNSAITLPSDLPLQFGQWYAWAVVARDPSNTVVIENNGRSEVCTFYVKDQEILTSSGTTPTYTPIYNTEFNQPYQPLPTAMISGQLDYRFHGDNIGALNSSVLQNNTFNNFIFNIGGSQNFGGTGSNSNTNYGGTTGDLSMIFGSSAALDNLQQYLNPANEPPAYLLPQLYNPSGGQPLKNTQIKFTMRYALGKTNEVTHTNQLDVINPGGYNYWDYRYSIPGQQGEIPLGTGASTVGVTTTDENGNFTVHIPASEHFGLVYAGPVTLHSGGGEFPISQTGVGLYRLITIEILDDRYCHPDAYMFPKPNEQLNLPKQISVVKSYNLKLQVKAKEHAQQMVSSGNPIPLAIVKIGRVKSTYETLPPNYPKGESKIYQFGLPMDNSNIVKLLCDSGTTDINGMHTFSRLVRPIGNCSNSGSGAHQTNTITDAYYIQAESHPNEGNINYNKGFKYNLAPCVVGINSLDNHGIVEHRSHDYVPPTYNYVLSLSPKDPEIYASTRANYGTGPQPVPYANVIFHVFKPGQPEILVPFQTDQNGFFKKQITSADYYYGFASKNAQGIFTSSYKMYYNKPGFSQLQCVDCTNNGLPRPLKMGERWRPEATLKPRGMVKGVVRDEAGNSVQGEVKIGDGVFIPLEMFFTNASGTVHDNGTNIQLNNNTLDPALVNSLLGGSGSTQPINNNSTYTNFSNLLGGSTTISGGTTANIGNTIPIMTNETGFNLPAQSGSDIMLIIRPYATNLFQDTFYVDIPVHSSGAAHNLGIFIVRKKLHRPVITVKPFNASSASAVIAGAQVILSDLPPKNTNAQGKASFTFPSPANEFRLQVIKDGYALYDEHVVIPVTKTAYPITVLLKAGFTLNGTVTDAQSGTPLAGARVYCKLGSNAYGDIIQETFTGSNGTYTLPNIPSGARTIWVDHVTEDITYVGTKKITIVPRSTPLDFALQKAPFHLPHIWNLPVALESFTTTETGWNIKGAFVNLPDNARFKAEKETQRLSFNQIPIHAINPQSTGQPVAEPTTNSIEVNENQFRAVLNNQHIMSLTGSNSSSSVAGALLYKINVDKSSAGNGEVKVKAFTLLEAFRMEYQYNSNFYLGESADNPSISAFKGTANTNMPETYKVMDLNSSLQPSNPTYNVHEFNAFADRELSYLRGDSIVLRTKLEVNLPLSNPSELEVDAGNIVVMPDAIYIFPGSSPLNFELEKWKVESNSWSFDPDFGGIVTSGTIKTDLLHFEAPQIIIRPNELILPNSQGINGQNLSLSGVTPLYLEEGTNLSFSYYNSPQHDPQNGHWRIALYNEDGPVSHIKDLPGWPANTRLNMQYLENFSDGFLAFSMMPNQQINHYNVIKQNVTHLFKATNGFLLAGTIDLEIPNLNSGYTANLIYYKEAGQTKVRLDGLVTNFESYGQVFFMGDQQSDRITLDWNLLKVPGKMTIYDDQAPNTIQLRAMLIKQPNDIRLEIFKTDQQGIMPGDKFQYIALGGGNNGKQKVLEGTQIVQGQSWDKLKYYAQWEGFNNGIKEGKDKMWFEVSGAIANDSSSPDQIQLANVDTPFGDFSLVYVFSDMSIIGSLTVQNMPLGSVYINEGAGMMQVGGKGFYLTAALDAVYPGIGQLNTNFIAGAYPNITPGASQLLKQGMYLEKLPNFLNQSGIQGLYMCANKTLVEEEFTIDLLVFAAGVYINTGIDTRFWVNIGESYGGAHIGGLIYADLEVYARVVVCSICFGLLGEVGMDIDYTWNPDNGFTGSVCGSVTVNMSMCGESVVESVKLEGSLSSSNGVDVRLTRGQSCGNPVSLNSNDCKHF
jgi:hypothetical protein